MASFYDPNNAVSLRYPLLSKENLYCEIELAEINEIIPIIQTQIEKLNELLIPQDFNIYSPYLDDFVEDELVFIDNNYFNLHNFDEMMDNEVQSRLIFSYLYELIVTDLIEDLIPSILKNNDYTSQDLLVLDLNELKSEIFKVLQAKNKTFKKIKSTINESDKYNEFQYNSMKYTYYFDLFDSDLENFRNNLLHPIIVKYQDEINSKVTKSY